MGLFGFGKFTIIGLFFFAILSIIIFQLSTNATTYLDFCETNGFDTAGTVVNRLACITEKETQYEWEIFECNGFLLYHSCYLTGEKDWAKKNSDLNAFIIDQNTFRVKI